MQQKDHEPKSFDPYWEKWGFSLLLTILGILLVIIFRNYILQNQIYLFKDNGADSLVVYYPRWLHVSKYLFEYGIPSWSFNCGMGQNIFPGEVNDPFNLLLYCCGKNLTRAIIYVELIKFVLTGITAFFYFRTMQLSKYSSLIGSLMLTFCGYMVAGSSGWYGHSSFVLYGVFWLLAFEQLYRNQNYFLFPIAVILVSTSTLFYIYIFTIFLFLYTLLRYFSNREWKKWRKLVILLLKMAGLGLLGLCMNAVFLVSPLLEMLNSPRISGASGYFNKLASKPMFGLADPLEYLTILLRFFSTDIFGTGEKFFTTINGKTELFESYQGWHNHFEAPLFYCTIPALLLMPQLFIFLNKKRKVLHSLVISFWVLILVFPFFRYSLYLFSGNYYKGGMNFFIPMLVIFYAITALNFLDSKKKINPVVLVVTAGVLLAILYLPALTKYAHIISGQIRLTATVLIMIYTVVIFLMNNSKYRNTAKIAFLGLLAGEVLCFSSITVNHRNSLSNKEFTAKCGYNDGTDQAIEYIKSIDKGFFRVQKDYVSTPTVYINMNDSQVHDFYGTPSYSSFNQKYYIAFIAGLGLTDPTNEVKTRWCMGVTQSPIMQSYASVKYGLAKNRNNFFEKFGYKLLKKIGDIYIYENPRTLPLGFSCDKFITESSFNQLDARQKGFAMMKAFTTNGNTESEKGLHKIGPESIPQRYAVTEFSEDVNKLKAEHLKLSQLQPFKISGKINLNKPKMMVFTIPYDPGWAAQVNGKETKINLVDFGLMGLKIPKGNAQVELTFSSPYLFLGLCISLISIGFYLSFFTLFLIRRSKQFQNAPENRQKHCNCQNCK